MERDIIIYFDGSSSPVNPGGTIGYGWHIAETCLQVGDYRPLYEGHGIAFQGGPSATNNVAEYVALAAAMIWCVGNKAEIDSILYRGDSQLVVNHLRGEWRVRHHNLKPIAAIVNMMIEQLREAGVEVGFEWVSRRQNETADALSSKIIKDALKDRMPLTQRLAEENGEE